MQTPKGSKGFLDRMAKLLVATSKYRVVKFLIGPLLLAAPPAIITALYSNPSAKAWIFINAPTLNHVLATYWWLLIVFSAAYPIIIVTLAKAVVKKAEANGLNVDGLLALLASLDAIVGCKETRFANFAASGEKPSKEIAFCMITQPNQQIAEIVREICNLFNALRTEKNKPLIRVVLAVMENGKIVELPIHYPADEPIRATIKQLNDPGSAIILAAKSRKTIIVEDIKKELQRPKKKKRFVDAGNNMDNFGSLICYPIIRHGNHHVPFVISIHCDEPCYFKSNFLDLYEHSLSRFALRMNLEYNLLVIKERICGQ